MGISFSKPVTSIPPHLMLTSRPLYRNDIIIPFPSPTLQREMERENFILYIEILSHQGAETPPLSSHS